MMMRIVKLWKMNKKKTLVTTSDYVKLQDATENVTTITSIMWNIIEPNKLASKINTLVPKYNPIKYDDE